MSDLRDEPLTTCAGSAADNLSPGASEARGTPTPNAAAHRRSVTAAATPATAGAPPSVNGVGKRLESRLARWSSWIRVDF